MIGRTLSHYRILERIGAGGMGEVYRARDERLERDVALKILPPGAVSDEGARKRFRKEALVLSRLNHPNIATVLDFDRRDDTDFLVMEYVAGDAVAERIHSGPLAEKEIARLGLELAEGIAAAHGQGVIHRDLKPGNLRLMPDGRLKILDFGLAQLLESPSKQSTQATETVSAAAPGVTAGTLPYMAPERLRGEGSDARSDIWAVGLVLYELATGRSAFPEGDSAQLITAILHEPPAPPTTLNRRVSPGLEGIIAKCLEKDPDNRYQSAKELVVDLRRLGTASYAVGQRPARRAPRRPWVAVGVVGLALALSAFALNVGGLRQRLLGGSSAAQVRSLAVLPLENLSKDPEQDLFATGMTDELITRLGMVRTLSVIARSSTMMYAGAKKPPAKVARDMGVDAIVEGSVLRVGRRVRINVALVEAKTERQLWAESYEEGIEDVLTIQGNVARAIAHQIGQQQVRGQLSGIASPRPVNPAAYEANLRGRALLLDRIDENEYKAAREQFEAAIRLDSTYAAAWVGLADVYYLMSNIFLPPNVAMPRVREMVTRALQLDNGSAEAHATLGVVLAQYEWNWKEAEREFLRSLYINPSYVTAHLYYANLLTQTGRHSEALVEIERARNLDPGSNYVALTQGNIYYYAAIYDSAETKYRALIIRDPDNGAPHARLALCYEQAGRHVEAVAEMQRALSLTRERGLVAWLGHIYAQAGRAEEAKAALEELLTKGQSGYIAAYAPALVYAGLGDSERTFAWLTRAYDNRDEELGALGVDPMMKPLRADPRFNDLLRRMRLTD